MRKLKLADAWVHFPNRTIGEVAARLNYPNERSFIGAYRKYFRRRPGNMANMILGTASLDVPSSYMRPSWWPVPMPMRGYSRWPGLPPDQLPEPFENSCKSDGDGPEPGGQSPVQAPSDLPSQDEDQTPPRTLDERFRDLEMIPLAEIIEFPSGLPVLLKAA